MRRVKDEYFHADQEMLASSELTAILEEMDAHGVERAIIRSVAKLAYETVTPQELPAGFAELAGRIDAAEAQRGAVRVDPPEQEVASVDGRLQLRFRPRARAEERGAHAGGVLVAFGSRALGMRSSLLGFRILLPLVKGA